MPFEPVKEIWELCRRVQKETGHYVSVSVKNFCPRELYVTVDIIENGYETGRNYDESYDFICNGENGAFVYTDRNKYEKCKKKLIGLLLNGKE